MMMQANPNRAALVSAISAGPDYRDNKVKQLLLKKEQAARDGADPWAHYDYDADLIADPDASPKSTVGFEVMDIRVDSKKMQFTPIQKPTLGVQTQHKNKMLNGIVAPQVAAIKGAAFGMGMGMPQVASIGGMSTIASEQDMKSMASNPSDADLMSLGKETSPRMVNGDGDDDLMDWVSKRQALVNSLSRGVDYRDKKVQELTMKREAEMLSKDGQMNRWVENYGGQASSLITDEKELFWAHHDYDAEYEFEEFVPHSIAPKKKMIEAF